MWPFVLMLAAAAAGFLALLTNVMGESCQSDGSGGANCDALVAFSYGIGVGAVLLLGAAVVVARLGR
jgi:hypothetical protein